jgi:hypothetical protein
MYPVPGKAKSDMICRAFAAGAPKSAKGAVFFGTEGQSEAFRKAKSRGEPWFYVDNSYFDKHRGIYFRVTKNALQVDPRGKTSDGERFAKLGVPIKPWRDPLGPDILIVPQSDQFMKSTLGCLDDWAGNMKWQLEYWGIGPARIHPWDRDKLKRNAAFSELLPSTRLVVTHSSAAAITALLEGVPAVSTSPTAAAHWIGGQITPADTAGSKPSIEERLQFANVLADNQFTLEEFRNGSAWRWLEKN